jgi:hypothetical protein
MTDWLLNIQVNSLCSNRSTSTIHLLLRALLMAMSSCIRSLNGWSSLSIMTLTQANP